MIMERVIFLTDNPLATKSFYRDVLELEIVEERDDSFTIQAGAAQITFQTTTAFARPFYHFAMNIPENKFSEAKSWLQARVALIEEDGEDEVFFTSWNAHSVYFEDPSGNIVEFIARHNLSNAISHPFGSGDIHGVSEVGVVANEVFPFVRALNDMGVPNWRADDEGLTPVGDEHGLFIVAKTDREWYFSNQKQAQFYPVKVLVSGIGWITFAAASKIVF
ncbi:VOC family protein [Paenibacillus thiaminolyticus]|uniref:Ring-cleaving dioxygenase n=1 Tax=Paenibacillus thiaminolyticus TaxID=49283 RepID=A0A3A3GC50_PANTH|nr:VOC family protein [Paenibacillus thiaminolyticus]RJG19138.1 ring-cleaving dioxygenase [Paenibacillus thiaminolyticus]